MLGGKISGLAGDVLVGKEIGERSTDEPPIAGSVIALGVDLRNRNFGTSELPLALSYSTNPTSQIPTLHHPLPQFPKILNFN